MFPISPSFFVYPGGSDGKESACNVGDPSLIPGSGRSPGEGNGKALKYSCLENSMDRGAWQVTVLGVTKSQTQLRTHAHTHMLDIVFLIWRSLAF